ncbi:Outer membrane protein beta-barrel domain-containing protein [Cyclobacterium xiamenense]|uniref:Outer membrane protein beta-barrel domain-containing protein n=1 Tax=Cyclobacterium xiamenense TaxID=1297121 RepID=A0A1H7AZN9_9BACT|nr:porin family protein [Cyclobacterium xiamenense]SEJ67612.1 Outer membrane protein beta-barrel domain-containing protein [Cyclobacterium xiamenense]
MRKVVMAITACVFFLQTPVMAQDGEREPGFGLRGGVSFFNWGGQDISSTGYTNRTGFHAGIYGNSFVGERFSVEPGIYYAVKGTQNDDLVNSRAVLNYLDAPLLFRLYATDAVNLFFGPQASLLLDSSFEADALGNTYDWETDTISDFDAAVVVGLGYNPSSGLNFQVGYDFGLVPVFKDSDADVFNRGFKVAVGISF